MDFDGFFAENYESVVRSLTFVTGDRLRAEDAVQGAFERAFRKWRRVSTLDRPGTWIYVVALRDERRRMRREAQEPAGPAPSEELAPDRTVAESDWVIRHLMTLPLRQRTAIVLRHLADLPLGDVAGAMGCSPGTVKATLHAAYRNLRVDIESEAILDAD